jgi:hypothetical protein
MGGGGIQFGGSSPAGTGGASPDGGPDGSSPDGSSPDGSATGGSASSTGGSTSSSGGSTSSAGGSTSSTGGAATDGGPDGSTDGGGCTSPSDCPPAAGECVTVTCTAGQCGTADVASGTPTSAQTAGDCHTNECDGIGNITSVVDDTDLPSNGNPCTTAVCTSGVPSNPAVSAGTACGNGLLCNSTGMCVGCVAPTDCPGTDTECETRTCNAGMCGFSFAQAGKPTTAQMPGDCHTNECDGAGNITSVVDNTDLPSNVNVCTSAACNAGVPSNPPLAAGTPCAVNGGIECNGAGTCVQCLAPAECPGMNTECQQPTCVAGACGINNAAAGTPTTTQTPGDCHTNECDGTGNIASFVDDTDVPSSSNQCAPGVCTAGVPSTSPAPVGTVCSQNGGIECDGAGSCVQCLTAATCPGTDTECATRTCTAGVCGMNDVAAGTPTSMQTPGDCLVNQCDGAGNIVSVPDDSDTPPSSNQCAGGTCKNGVLSTGNAAQGTACTQSGGALCDGQGNCTQTITVVRVGAGTAALVPGATATFLETYYPVAGATPVSTVTLPVTATLPSEPLLLGGTSITEGGLSRSGDGHTLVLAGYAATAGEATTTAGVTRVVGRIDAAGTVDTTTRLAATAFADASVRGAASVDGNNFWVSGTSSPTSGGGVWYVPLGAAGGGTQITDTPSNMRMVSVFAGALYGDSGSGAFTGVLSFGGLPTTTGATATILSGMTTTNPGGFVLLDLDPTVPGVDTLFVADSSAGLERWTLSGTTWTRDTAFNMPTGGCYGVAGWSNGNGATLVASMSAGTLQRVDVTTTGSPTATLLVTAATDTAYRGVALAPH